MDEHQTLSPNELAFIALTNEYCQVVEQAYDYDRSSLVDRLTKLLPRIYITALDLQPSAMLLGNEIASSLEEEQYNAVSGALAQLFAEEDVYLEVFHEDMKYSDTPIAVNISENLADLYQEFYEMLAAVRDLNVDNQQEIISLCRDHFDSYWSTTLCNVLRAINNLRMNENDYDY